MKVLDHGYVKIVEHWGSDERIIEAARMSTQKGFQGWGPKHPPTCDARNAWNDCLCADKDMVPGDEKLLKYLWENEHASPFEMAGAIFEVKAPIFVLREWMRHRTQSFNEMSARYVPLPNENYVPTAERLRLTDNKNKQAQGAAAFNSESAETWLTSLSNVYELLEHFYQMGLSAGIPKEVARVVLPVGRYSAMRASANLRNWLAFLKLRCDPTAQWEIRQYANCIREELTKLFPRTLEVAHEL